MPLLDHFHSSWSNDWPSEGVHSAWATTIATQLNQGVLPPDYHAIPLVSLGTEMEIDVATLHRENGSTPAEGNGLDPDPWAPPAPTQTAVVDFPEPDLFEVQVLRRFGGSQLRAAIELVSPANKDRPSNRRAFALKCAGYLQRRVSVVLVDVVTHRHANLHADIAQVLNWVRVPVWDSPSHLYSVAYRRILSSGQHVLEFWGQPLAVGAALPTMPLWIDVDFSLPLRLEESYTAACAALRLPH
jgi:hypothetical protein